MNVISIILFSLLLIFPISALSASWDYSKHSVPLEDIMSGGPPRDGIPALFSPKHIKVSDAGFMRDEEQVLGVYHNRVARAYPTRIISWHELVNDRFGNDPLLVSW
jgi:hypothetical protein